MTLKILKPQPFPQLKEHTITARVVGPVDGRRHHGHRPHHPHALGGDRRLEGGRRVRLDHARRRISHLRRFRRYSPIRLIDHQTMVH